MNKEVGAAIVKITIGLILAATGEILGKKGWEQMKTARLNKK
jgi:hypothetical protein